MPARARRVPAPRRAPRQAREPLRRALDLAGQIGARPLQSQAETELRACGARPRSLAYTGVESLTPSERRVAELVAAGRSNPEVAQALFVPVPRSRRICGASSASSTVTVTEISSGHCCPSPRTGKLIEGR